MAKIALVVIVVVVATTIVTAYTETRTTEGRVALERVSSGQNVDVEKRVNSKLFHFGGFVGQPVEDDRVEEH